MFWIDLGLLGFTAYRMVNALKANFFLLEKIALAFLFAMGLKSLIIFSLIGAGVRPVTVVQIGVLGIILVLTFWQTKPFHSSTQSAFPSGLEWQTILTFLLIGVLFLFSLVNAWFLPIMESDAAWYQVKGLSFIHEVRFDSEWIVPQLRQYPPFVPLLFSWFISFDIEPLRMFFPFFYLALSAIFYCRVLEHSGNSKMAAMLTLTLATTPYIWWHGALPFLDLCTAVFYSLGAIYWFFWMKSTGVDREQERCRSLAFLSGLFFGLSAWTRLEFMLYCLIPIAIVLCSESMLAREDEKDRKSFMLFFISLLIFPTIWFINLAGFDSPLFGRVKIVIAIGVLAWIVALAFVMGNWRLKAEAVIKVGLFAGVFYIILICLKFTEPMPGWEKLLIALYRTVIVQAFYLFTAFLAVFVFFERFKNILNINKAFGMFLLFYPLVHFAIFSYSPAKWPTFGHFVSATFVNPGNSLNLSDTRGMISMYPLLLFYIACIPFVRRGFNNE